MSHVDALSRNPLLETLLIEECKNSLIDRLKRAQKEDDELKNIVNALNEGKSNGYVLKMS
jgi:hypothetical protein